jgi:DNA mismatch repair protein MLH3
MPFSPAGQSYPSTPLPPFSARNPGLHSAEVPTHHNCTHEAADTRTTEVNFSKQSLTTAMVIGQVDNKFITCLLESPTEARILVLIDQHAADERVAVEELLQELCQGFMNNDIRQTEVSGSNIVLTLLEAGQLAIPGILEVFARWGIMLTVPSDLGDGNYVQVKITAVPTLLASRLARKEASEMTRLVRLHLDHLTNNDALEELQSLLSRYGNQEESEDWQRVQRWMPKEMLEVANSKACRSTSISLVL